MATKKAKKPELKIVFDTNVLYTKAESYLLRKEVADLISVNNNHNDIEIGWHLPEVVRHERQYQMRKKSLELLPSVQKLEKVLGHNLNITNDIITSRVNDAVEKQMSEYKLKTIKIDPSKVDWNSLMHKSVYREPPFDSGESEKGFRDALVAETFVQLVDNSPITPKSCRLVLVTDDQLLRDSLSKRLHEKSKNVRILPSIEELKGYINTLVSQADEEFIGSIQEKSQIYFFSKGDNETLYYKEDVGNKIKEKFENELIEMPTGVDYRENGTWYIGEPQFVKKDGQRIYWATRIRVITKLYKFEIEEGNPSNSNEQASIQGIGRPTGGFRPVKIRLPEKILIMEGSTVFEVDWSISVTTTTKSISKPLIDNICYVETIWDSNNL